MGSFIRRKREKVSAIFDMLGPTVNEETFISKFKETYPADWILINEKWEFEEKSTPIGKKHPMQHPDVYMKEMYRNGLSRRTL